MGMTYIYPPVTVSTLPPVGGATSANQVLEIAELTNIFNELTTGNNESNTNQLVIISELQSGIKETAKTGSFDEKLSFVSVQTFTAPAGAVSGNIMNVGSSNVRYKQGAAASTTSGLRLEPGRSEQILNGSNISVISEDGVSACDVAIIWNVQP